MNNYRGTIDTMVLQAFPKTTSGSAGAIGVDTGTGVDEQTLIAFMSLFGSGPGQIPLGATITSATLTLQTTNGSTQGGSLHRMRINWDASATWSSLGSGVQIDGTEAVATADLVTGSVSIGSRAFDVTKSVQAWAAGGTTSDAQNAANRGWVFKAGGTDGWDFSSSEGTTKPLLTVTYTVDSSTQGNSAPVVTTSGTLSYTENNPAVAVAPALTVSDSNSANLVGATVRIGNGHASGQDVLALANQNGITGAWNASTGILTLSGTASVAQYEAALRSVTYQNTSENPSGAIRTVEFQVNDGSSADNLSAVATQSVQVTAVNDAPVAINDAYSTSQGSALTVATAAGLLANDKDPDNTALSSVLVTGPSHGVLSLNANGSFSYTPATGYSGSDSFTYKVSDGTVDSNVATVGLTITSGTPKSYQVSFQQGVNGYAGTLDTMVRQASPGTSYGGAATLNPDGDDPSGTGQDNQALLLFSNLFGTASGQIPAGAMITSATLTLQTTNAGDGTTLHRMLTPWSGATATWTSLQGGIQADGTDAVAKSDGMTGKVGALGATTIDVTASLQAWAGGKANYGWALLPTGGDGWGFDSAEGTTKPRLAVTYTLDSNTPAVTPFSGSVSPRIETPSLAGTGDVADDTAIWIHPKDPSQSTIIGTDKHSTQGGLYVFDLQGKVVDTFSTAQAYNNVDLRYGFRLGQTFVDFVGATNRATNNIDFFTVDPITREINPVGSLSTGLSDVYGLTLYHAPDGNYHALASTKTGTVRQFALDGATGVVRGTELRTIQVGAGEVEGMVVDDRSGALYIAEEAAGIWKYSIDPATAQNRTQVDKVGGGHLTADVEGLTIYYGSSGAGYLIASSQGNSTFAIYDRAGSNPYLGSFQVLDGNGIDGVTSTDGIEVTNVGLGAAFDKGMLVVHDSSNPGGTTSNYKLVPWDAVAALGGLITDTTHDPRDGWIL
ncbi:MAG TPA: phytase [Microvirga sp.]|nr:phytase [Microvirga sp.]